MRHLRHPILASLLVAFLLVLGGAFSAQAVQHSAHHAHHNAATHASPLCTWFCASGQVLQAFDFGLNGPSFGLFVFEPWIDSQPVSLFLRSPFSRGPPSLFSHL